MGKALTLDDKSYTIVGVLPPNFSLYRTTDVFVPIGQWNSPALKVRSAALRPSRNWPTQARRNDRARRQPTSTE